MWLSHPLLEDSIKQWWSMVVNGSAMFRVAKKIRFVKGNIRRWNKDVFGNLFASKSAIQCELKDSQDKIHVEGYSSGSLERENDILKKYHEIIAREEVIWKHRSKALWLFVAEKNTRFFHLTALKHKAANRISKLVVGDRTLLKDDKICGEASRFFASLLLAEDNLDVEAQNSLLEAIPSILNEEQNMFLLLFLLRMKLKLSSFPLKVIKP